MPHDSQISPEQPVEYSFSKDKLPKTLSYPLKRALLDEALRSASVYESVWYVNYSRHRYGSVVLRAHFSPEQYSYGASGKISITVWAVSAKERKEAEMLLVRDGLPVLCEWIRKAKVQQNAWRGFGHILKFEKLADTLRHVEEEP